MVIVELVLRNLIRLQKQTRLFQVAETRAAVVLVVAILVVVLLVVVILVDILVVLLVDILVDTLVETTLAAIAAVPYPSHQAQR